MSRLTQEDEATLGVAMHSGSQAARDRLWLAAVPIAELAVQRLAKEGKLGSEYVEEAQAEAYAEIGNSLPKWKPEDGRLSTFLLPRLRGRVLDWLRLVNKAGVATAHAVRHDRVTILDLEGAVPGAPEEAEVQDAPGAHATQSGSTRGDVLSYGSLFIGDTPQPVETTEPFKDPEGLWDQERAMREVAYLPPQEHMAVRLHYGRGLSVAEVAEAMSLSRQHVHRLLTQAVACLRDRLQQP